MTATFTVILPHKWNDGNDRAFLVALDRLLANTDHEFALITDVAIQDSLQKRVNQMVRSAPTDLCVYTASDMFMAPHWDTPMLEAVNLQTFVTGVVVEPRAIALHPQNYERDFGRKPDQFHADQFDGWTLTEAPMLDGEGWYCPYMFHRDAYFQQGGLEETLDGEFNDADMRLFARFKVAGGQIKRVRSFCYHLQRYSDVDEQAHPKRG